MSNSIRRGEGDTEVLNLECIDLERFKNTKGNKSVAGEINPNVNKITSRISSKFHIDVTTSSKDLLKQNLKKLNYESKRSAELNSLFKNLLRINNWHVGHEIRRYLWSSLLILTNEEEDSRSYVQKIQTLYGQSNQINEIDIDFPRFVNIGEHSNFYYLNSTGKFRVKRLLSVYAYNYPDLTFSPMIISISSLLLHYMQEHEVYASICYLFSKKDHLVETKLSWDANCLVFNKLLKLHGVCSEYYRRTNLTIS